MVPAIIKAVRDKICAEFWDALQLENANTEQDQIDVVKQKIVALKHAWSPHSQVNLNSSNNTVLSA